MTVSDWVASSAAAESTWEAAPPVWSARDRTRATLDETSWVPRAASEALREISAVAAVCYTTVAAMAPLISFNAAIVPPICRMAVVA